MELLIQQVRGKNFGYQKAAKVFKAPRNASFRLQHEMGLARQFYSLKWRIGL
jgi:hypothetical protein